MNLYLSTLITHTSRRDFSTTYTRTQDEKDWLLIIGERVAYPNLQQRGGDNGSLCVCVYSVSVSESSIFDVTTLCARVINKRVSATIAELYPKLYWPPNYCYRRSPISGDRNAARIHRLIWQVCHKRNRIISWVELTV